MSWVPHSARIALGIGAPGPHISPPLPSLHRCQRRPIQPVLLSLWVDTGNEARLYYLLALPCAWFRTWHRTDRKGLDTALFQLRVKMKKAPTPSTRMREDRQRALRSRGTSYNVMPRQHSHERLCLQVLHSGHQATGATVK